MAVLSAFSLPAFIQDLPAGSPEDIALKEQWNINVEGWIQQAMPTLPSWFYDPTRTDIPSGTAALRVEWGAFPGRLDQYFSKQPPNPPANPYNLSDEQVYELADTGFYTDNQQSSSFPQIPATLCPQADWNGELETFGPYGPRGWLDEYCEWSAARDASGNLVRVDFACENPEYWYTLWKIDPAKVCALYESVLNWDAPESRQVKVLPEDLWLYDTNGNVVNDPETNLPAYNPLNKWNNSPVSQRNGDSSAFTGGVMHLTSTPNTLQTELGLAGSATLQYNSGNSDPQILICCGNYGQEYRHSDPHIGQSVNQVVGGQALGKGCLVCLADPVGLYIQNLTNPAALGFGSSVNQSLLPSGAQATDIWQVVRGSASLVDPVTGQDFPGAFNLHVVCQIPSAWLAGQPDLTLADITINGEPILYAGQIANQFDVGLYVRPLPAGSPAPQVPCASTAPMPGQPLQCMYSVLWNAYYAGVETAPTGATMSLASNTTMIAPQVQAGGNPLLTLTCNPPSGNEAPTVSVMQANGAGPDPTIQVEVLSISLANYAVPGNS
ncbi:MAG TPA: hypothetical protein VEL74_06730, partial [Thermoanaerobaculia bacterium]|nr:hypothetical protein [Thermoanaerobaculia bacterium]